MAWLEITIDTCQADVEAVCAGLTARGFADLCIEDEREFEEFLEDNRAYWDYIDEKLQSRLRGLSQVKLYLEDSDAAGLARVRAFAEEQGLPIAVEAMPDTDWSESWKDNYPPQEVGERLVVLPYWLADSFAGSRTKVILDPGLTFGTGAHPSTQMVMEEMEKVIQPGFRCLDLGSGSGILSIAALALGAQAATGVDIDPKAEDMSRENAGYNGFGAPEFTALTGNVTEDKALMAGLTGKPWQLVLVNIVADVIIGLCPVLPRFLGEDTTLILSGILDTRLEDVLAALEKAGIAVKHIRQKEDWRCVVAGKRNAG